MPTKVLHVGFGGADLPDWFTKDVEETTLDIDPCFHPDIIGDITNLGTYGEFDMVFSCHTLEHVPRFAVTRVLHGFMRNLRDGGTVLNITPDLEDIKPNLDVVYHAPSGPVTGLDMYYGGKDLVECSPFFAHYNAFTVDTMTQAYEEAGLRDVKVLRSPLGHNLVGIGVK